jgi:lycopene cyclase domain-containing protein
MKAAYLLIDLGALLPTLAFSFHPRIRFYRHWPEFLPALIAAGSCFSVWDIIFTRKGYWGFNPDYVLGYYCWGLPLEEWLFFLCIPYACVFTFQVVHPYLEQWQRPALMRKVLVGFALVVLLTGLVAPYRPYTTITFLTLGLLLGLTLRFGDTRWMGNVLLTYALLLGPFFLINGLLTGLGWPTPIVWYNPDAFLGMRIGTIPLEDFFYGMELVFLNLLAYRSLQTWKKKRL